MKATAGKWCALSGLILLGANSLLADYWESRAHGPGPRVAHSVVFTGHEVIVWGGGHANTWLNDGARYDVASDTWTPISGNHHLEGRWWHAAVWTGKEMIIWGGRGTFFPQMNYGNGARYNPETDTWTPMSNEGAPSPRSQLCAVWTGTEMIVWGGTGDAFDEKGDGARYNPETDTWTPLPPAPLNARIQPSAIWSGSEMIIFGGLKIDNYLSNEHWSTFGDGAAYDPASNTWRMISSQNAPGSRTAHTAIWTGKEMMVWGGRYLPDYTFLNSGGSYDPVHDRWTPIAENGAPQARSEQAAVWSGTEMIIWGGYVDPSPTEVATGGRYNPETGTWTATTMDGAPEARFFGGGIASVWTGKAMFIYGGWVYPAELNTTALYYPEGGPVVPPHSDSWETLPDGPHGRACHSTVLAGDEVIVWGGGIDGYFLNEGGRFDLKENQWRPVSTVGAPSARWFHGAVWTGNEMIIWGGRANFYSANHNTDGGRYDPRSDRWRPVSQVNAPSPRSQFVALWTGSEMIVWGGMGDGVSELSDGGAYNPERDTWTRLSPAPLEPRLEPSAIWTGEEMIVFGGLKIENYLSGNELWNTFGNGARYNPRTGHWRLLNSEGAPSSRTVHSAVWTGSEMLVWGGRYLNYPSQIAMLRDGASYDPATDSWTPIPTAGAPLPRAGHAGVWSGSEMIVWGGWDESNRPMNTGGRYNPISKTWLPTTLVNVPHPRFFEVQTASVWTERGMFIYGGYDYPISLNSAALYHAGPSALGMLEDLIARLRSLDLPRKAERPLLASLEAAFDSLDRGKGQAAANQLEAFQRKVESQLGDDPAAQGLIDAAQAILDRLR